MDRILEDIMKSNRAQDLHVDARFAHPAASSLDPSGVSRCARFLLRSAMRSVSAVGRAAFSTAPPDGCDLATSLGHRRCGCLAGAFRFAAERGGPLFRVQARHLEHAEGTANRQDDSKGRGRGPAQSKWREARIGDGESGSDHPPISAAKLRGAPGACVLSRCE
jgi:hypothetical protein